MDMTLKHYREKKNVSQKELARRASITTRTLGEYETGKRILTPEYMEFLMNTVDEIHDQKILEPPVPAEPSPSAGIGNSDAVRAMLSPIVDAMMNHGITPDMLAQKLKEELEAERSSRDVDGEIIRTPDMKIRQSARQDAHKLLNHYPAEKKEITGADGGAIQHEHTVKESMDLGALRDAISSTE